MIRFDRVLFAGLVCLSPLQAFSAPAPAALGPFTRTETIAGVPVTMVTSVEISAADTGDDSGVVTAKLLVDLSDLQAKIPKIVATFPLPRNSCAAFKPDNLVTSISGATLKFAAPNGARLLLNGRADVWTCIPNPLTGRALTRTMVGTNYFTAVVPFTLAKDTDRSAKLVVGEAQVDVQQGGIASLFGAIMGIAGVAFQRPAYDAFAKAIDPKLLLLALPKELDPFDPIITAVSFTEDNGKLAASIQLNAKVPEVSISALFGKLTGH